MSRSKVESQTGQDLHLPIKEKKQRLNQFTILWIDDQVEECRDPDGRLEEHLNKLDKPAFRYNILTATSYPDVWQVFAEYERGEIKLDLVITDLVLNADDEQKGKDTSPIFSYINGFCQKDLPVFICSGYRGRELADARGTRVLGSATSKVDMRILAKEVQEAILKDVEIDKRAFGKGTIKR